MDTDLGDPSLRRLVRPERIVGYAVSSGWVRISNKRPEVAIFNSPSRPGRFEQLIVPLNMQVDDYGERIGDAIVRLARVEGGSADKLLSLLLAPPSDVLRFRVDQPDTADGSVAFLEGLELLRGAEKSLRSAACTVRERKRFHSRLTGPQTDMLVQNARLGQTERGSFVALIIVPLDAVPEDRSQLQLFEQNPNPPFARRVTALLMESVQVISSALAASRPEDISRTDATDVMVSANLCEALLAMQPSSARGNVEITAAWDKTVPIAASIPIAVTLRAEVFPALERVASQLRPVEQPREMRFIGKVSALMGKPDANGHMAGEIVFQFQEDDELLRAKIVLNATEYSIACDAHKTDAFVSTEGTLLRRPRLHHVENPRNFRLLIGT